MQFIQFYWFGGVVLKLKYKTGMFIVIIVFCIGILNISGVLPTKWRERNLPQVDIKRILENVKYLSSDEEFQMLYYRIAGREGEKKAAKYIEENLKKSEVEVSKQPFEFYEVVKENSKDVRFTYNNGIKIEVTSAKIFSNENIDEIIPGKLIDLGNGSKKEFEAKVDQLKGKFVLIKIDNKTSIDDFSYLEASKQVKGIIAYVPDFSAPTDSVITNKFILKTSKAYGEKVTTITTIKKKDYDKLVKAFDGNREIPIQEYLNYNIEIEKRTSQNIIVTKESKDRSVDKPLIIIGAHYDSVNGPGANDNATGTAALMELVRILSKKELDYDVQFVAFGAEEVGLLGSRYFVANLPKGDIKRCRFMINIEATGIGEVLAIGKSTGEKGDLEAQKLACGAAKKNKIAYKKFEFGDSDQFYFNQEGIPTITFATLEYDKKYKKPLLYSTDPEYHTFYELEKENIIPPESDDSLNDTFDIIEKSNKHNDNFKKLFVVLLEILNKS